ncbi:MAG TPA: urea carboxylase-associated family protein [Thermomicrobiales bacterium]|nr:urea carboxylase-associated family protein [Thermomicrobiales bacterium]
MTNVLVGQRAVAAKQLASGAGAAFEVTAGQLLHIIDLAGGQVASMIAYSGRGHNETLSPTATMTINASLTLKQGSQLYSDACEPMFELVEDPVGRHDLLTMPQPSDGTTTKARETSTTRDALSEAAESVGVYRPGLPSPVNFFKHVVVKQRGEIEVRDPFSERNDAILLRVLKDAVVIIANAHKEKKPGISQAPGRNEKPGMMLVRVYQSAFSENGSA